MHMYAKFKREWTPRAMHALCDHSSKLGTYIWVVNGKTLWETKPKYAMCYNEIGLCVQIKTIVICSQVNTLGKACSTT
jgi:hypothetical protein